MATLDEIFASMPDEAASGTHELLVIDPDTRQIYVPDAEEIFGVEHDGNAETKYFQCPRYVGKGIDLAACFLRINYQNANGERDGYLVSDTTVNGENIYFSWELSPKVTQYQGSVQFVLCASLPGSTKTNDWHTTLAQGKVLEGLEPDAEAVAAASSDVIAQLLALVAAQSDNVEAVGADQVAKVQAEGTHQVEALLTTAAQAENEALAEIEAKKQSTLAEIPDDYTTMAAQVDTLTRSTAGAIVCEAEGVAIQVADASDNYLPGLWIFGRSTQDGEPTPDNPVEIVNTPAPVVVACGKNLWNPANNTVDITAETGVTGWGTTIWKNPAVRKTLRPNTTYTMRFKVTCISVPEYETLFSDNCGFVLYSGQPGGQYMDMGMSTGAGALKPGETRNVITTFTTPADVAVAAMNYEILRYAQRYLTADGTAVYATVRFEDVQMELGDTTTEYEPYTGTVVQIANDLPGIPVASGGNYTDADGQAWICDEVDLGRGVYVQRVYSYTVTGDETMYDNGLAEVGAAGNLRAEINGLDLPVPFSGDEKNLGMCSHYNYRVTNKTPVSCWVNKHASGNGRLRFVDTLERFPTLADFTAFAKEEYAAGTPITVSYLMETPTEWPLSEAELAAFAALRSVKPCTTILNDSGAHMAVEYVADTKLYIDRKLAELVAALNA